jgi:hypothetical protein
VAGLAVLALGAGFFLLTRGQESSTAAPTLSAQELRQRAAAQGNTKAIKPKAARSKKRTARKPAQPPAANGLPASVASALQRKRVVIVALSAPDLPLDVMAVREAQAGAAAAGAGFVQLNVLNESQARPLTELLGVLEDPSVLVFRRPGEMFLRLSGFADQQTVAQAARNASL